ncbi:phosphopantetheine-binding protein [Actinoplanes sp. NPDC051343]|uniref:phosphopantetheine-binding protein n=1 Tax=Actinoplanes sp. NPDC051343 TaxID=3363906 RepID=UPI003793BE3D
MVDLLAAAWNTALALSAIDKDADFFRPGGTSLMATRLIGDIKGQIRTPLSLGTFR